MCISGRMMSDFFLPSLISNSLKFKKENVAPKIILTASLFKDYHPELNPHLQYHLLCFEDNGIGFDQKHGHKIFELFQRLHTKDNFEGTGIGLSIVKKIVDNHGGLITAEGLPDFGAKFRVYIPIRNINT